MIRKQVWIILCCCVFAVLWEWGCQFGVTLCQTGAECPQQQRCIDKRCQNPPSDNNRPPIARAGQSLRVKKGERVRLDGSTSSDVDLDRLTYQWSFAKKPEDSKAFLENENNPQSSFVADVSGTFEVKLTVTDALGSRDDDVITVKTNYPPRADAGGEQLVLPGATVILKGSDSWDTDPEDKLSYTWKLLQKPDGSKAALQTPDQETSRMVADQPGQYIVELRVSDGLDESTDILKIQVADPEKLVPVLQGLDPWQAPRRSIAKVTLLGDNFILGAKVFFDDQELASEYRSRNRMTVVLDLQNVTTGAHKIKLQNPGGKTTEPQLFQVDEVPKPVLAKLEPDKGTVGQTVSLLVKGQGFVVGARVIFADKPLVTKYVDMTQLQAEVSLQGRTEGKYEVLVENEPDKRSNTLLFEVVVLPPKPVVLSHRFLLKTGGTTTSSGQIDTDYEYLHLTARGTTTSTQVWINDIRYGGKVEINLTTGTDIGNIYLPGFSTKGYAEGHIRIVLKNASATQEVEGDTYRIYLSNPYVPSVSYLRFYEENNTVQSSGATEIDYKYLDILGNNFQGEVEVLLDGQKYSGSVAQQGVTQLRLEKFSTKGMSVGEHRLLVRNRVNGKEYNSNLFLFTLTDGRIPLIQSVTNSDNTSVMYTNRVYTFLRIAGRNLRPDTQVLIDGIRYTLPIQNDRNQALYLYQFSTETAQPGSHTIVLRNVVGGTNFDSPVQLVSYQDGSRPRILSVSFRPVSVVYLNEVYQVTMSVDNVQPGAKVLLDGKEYAGVVQTSPQVILLTQFDTAGLIVGSHVFQLRNEIKGQTYDSNPYTFSVTVRPPPAISVVAPSVIQEKVPIVFRVSGSNFATGAKLFVGGVELTARVIGTYQIDAELDPRTYKTGRYDVEVRNPDGQKSNKLVVFVVPDLGPTLLNAAPNQIHLSADTTTTSTIQLYVYGNYLQSGAEVWMNQKQVGQAVVSTGTGNYATIILSTASFQGLSGEVSLKLKNPDGKESNETEITVFAPTFPEIYQVSPGVIPITTSALTLTIFGRGFSPKSEVRIDGKSYAVSAYQFLRSQDIYGEQLTVTIPAGEAATWNETVKLEIRNPDGKTSSAYRITNYENNKTTGPSISYISPSTVFLGQSSVLTATISGNGFSSGATVYWNNKEVPTVFISTRSLRATVPLSGEKAGEYLFFEVKDQGKLSNPFPLSLRRGPLITSLTPPMLEKNSTVQVLTLSGSGLIPGAQLKMFGRTFLFSSTNQVQIVLTPQDLLNIKAGLHTFFVEYPGTSYRGPTAGIFVIDASSP